MPLRAREQSDFWMDCMPFCIRIGDQSQSNINSREIIRRAIY